MKYHENITRSRSGPRAVRHTHDEPEIVDDADTERFLTEILGAAENGLPEDEITAAYDQLTDWHVTAAMVELWHRREITLRWDSATRDLVLMRKAVAVPERQVPAEQPCPGWASSKCITCDCHRYAR